jgi:hypothetical protein
MCTLPAGFPPSWLGTDFECYRLPAGDGATCPRVRAGMASARLLWSCTVPSMRLTGGGS